MNTTTTETHPAYPSENTHDDAGEANAELAPQAPPVEGATTNLSAEYLEYHRLSRAWKNPRWWKPVVGLLLTGAAYIAATMVLLLALLVVDPESFNSIADEPLDESLDMYDQTSFGLVFGMIALMLPAALVGFRLVGMKPVGLLSSVAGRLRWKLMLRCVYPAVTALLFSMALGQLISPESPESAQTISVSAIWILMLLILVPLQAAAEEYVFRGGLMQTIGAWLRHPAWAILLPVPLFVVGHGYNLPGQLSIAVFAVACGWLTWRTGGLEAAIVLHVVNNVVVAAMGFAGMIDANQTQISWLAAVTSTVPVLIYTLWVDQQERRREGLQA